MERPSASTNSREFQAFSQTLYIYLAVSIPILLYGIHRCCSYFYGQENDSSKVYFYEGINASRVYIHTKLYAEPKSVIDACTDHCLVCNGPTDVPGWDIHMCHYPILLRRKGQANHTETGRRREETAWSNLIYCLSVLYPPSYHTLGST